MPAYTRIRTASWLPDSPDASVTARYQALPFPEQWREVLLELCNAGRPTDAEPYRTVPTRRMEQVLQTFAPDYLVLPRPRDGRGHWLLVPEGVERLPDQVFRALYNAWLSDLRPDMAKDPHYRELLAKARAMLDDAPPRWEPVELELLRCPVTEGGTAAPLAHQYPLTTDWFARKILALEPYDYGSGTLRFHAVPHGPRDQGAELVSEPLRFDKDGQRWWYSITLNVTLHTVPFEPLPRIHLHTGIRRWATRVGAAGRLYLPRRRRTTVLLRPRVPWLPGASRSDWFAVARLERRWDREARDWVTGWVEGGPAGMLHRLSLSSFPDAEAIVTAPEEWLADDMSAAVVYSTAMGSHGVLPGLMPHQRSELVAWAEQAFAPELRPEPERVRTRLGRSTPLNTPPKTKTPEYDRRRAAKVRAAAAHAMRALGAVEDDRAVLEAWLLWQTPQMRDEAVEAFIGLLGLGGGSRAAIDALLSAASGPRGLLEWRTPELLVRLHCRRLTEGLGDDLALPEGRRTKAMVTAAVAERRDRAARWMAAERPGTAPSLALVELDRAADFTTSDHDPKFALRLGFAKAGLLTQFVAVPKKTAGYDSTRNVGHRAEKAWDDGLRQLGVRVLPEHGLSDGLPEGLRYAAIWLVRKNRTSRTRWAGHVPVAVLVAPGPEEGIAEVRGWDAEADGGAGAWIPYPSLLLRLTERVDVSSVLAADDEDEEAFRRPDYHREMERQRRQVEEWLQTVLRTLRGVPTLLLACAQNVRSHWTWLQDGQVQRDRVRTGVAPHRRLDPDLRLLRVRKTTGRETPQWWGVHPKDGLNGLAAHLWVAPRPDGAGGGRVFWSTTPKPSQFKDSAVSGDKLGGRPLTRGSGRPTIDADKVGWNPGLVELAVLGCHEDDGDDPEALAMAAHHLRQPPDYPQALALPLPLHLAELAQEYVLPLPPEDSEETAHDEDPPGEGPSEPETAQPFAPNGE